MAFNFFKKKEVVENTNGDLIDNIKNQSFNDEDTYNTHDLNLSSFESNFSENMDGKNAPIPNLQQINNSSLYGNDNNSYMTLNSNFEVTTSPSSDINYNESNFLNENSITQNNFTPLNNINNLDPIPDYDHQMNMGNPLNINNNISNNSGMTSNNLNNVSNINNYDYNPVIDNIETASNMINDSQDVNSILSSMHNKKEQSLNNSVAYIPEYDNQMNMGNPLNINNNNNEIPHNNSEYNLNSIIINNESINQNTMNNTPIVDNYDYDMLLNNEENVNTNTLNMNNIESGQPRMSIFNETVNEEEYVEEVEPGYKRCPKCGQKMREDYKQCFVCGTMI